jgi:hypothetical protein
MAATRTAQPRPRNLHAGGHEICTPGLVRRRRRAIMEKTIRLITAVTGNADGQRTRQRFGPANRVATGTTGIIGIMVAQLEHRGDIAVSRESASPWRLCIDPVTTGFDLTLEGYFCAAKSARFDCVERHD